MKLNPPMPKSISCPLARKTKPSNPLKPSVENEIDQGVSGSVVRRSKWQLDHRAVRLTCSPSPINEPSAAIVGVAVARRIVSYEDIRVDAKSGRRAG